MWLPLAMSDVYALLVANLRIWMKNPEALAIPKRSEILGRWALPMMSRAMSADEKEREALALLDSVRSLKKRFNK